MKQKRILCLVLALILTSSLLTLPVQAAAKPAFQWLMNYTKNNGTYNEESKTYSISWYMDDSESDKISLKYSTKDGTLRCIKSWSGDYTILILKPSLSTPYQVIYENVGNFKGEYSVNPSTYTENTKLHYTEFSGDSAYSGHVDSYLNASLPWLLEAISNLLVLEKSGFTLKDLGFSKFSRHKLHVYTEPEPVEPLHCGDNNYYQVCLICGKRVELSNYVFIRHIKGDFVWDPEPTCTDYGFGGYDRIDHRTEFPTFTNENGELGFFAYLPSRTATVFRKK